MNRFIVQLTSDTTLSVMYRAVSCNGRVKIICLLRSMQTFIQAYKDCLYCEKLYNHFDITLEKHSNNSKTIFTMYLKSLYSNYDFILCLDSDEFLHTICRIKGSFVDLNEVLKLQTPVTKI